MAITLKTTEPAVLSGLIDWHEKLAALHLSDSDKATAASYQAEADRQTKLAEDNAAIWRKDIKNVGAKDRAIRAERLALQAQHMANIAASPPNHKSYVTHSLVAAQLRAHNSGGSLDDAVGAEMKRLLDHDSEGVRVAAVAHPNHRLVAA
jgi:hypothetical protein